MIKRIATSMVITFFSVLAGATALLCFGMVLAMISAGMQSTLGWQI